MRYYLDYNASAPMDERVKSYIKETIDMYAMIFAIKFNFIIQNKLAIL